VNSERLVRSLQIGDVWFEDRPGGLSRVYAEMLRHFPAAGMSASGLVVGSERASKSTANQVRAYAKADDLLPTRLFAARRAVVQALAHQSFDLVVSHFALYAAPVLDKFRALPLVVHFQGPWAAEGSVEKRQMLRRRAQHLVEAAVYRSASRLIVLSNAFARELASRYGVHEERIRMIPPGVDLDRFNTTISRLEARERLNWPGNRPTVFALRRLVRRMGLENLIEAVPEIIREIPDLQVHIGGTGSLEAALRNKIKDLNVSHHVKLLGRIEDDALPVCYRAADVSIVPTIALEGFGLITLESMAAGTPVMVTPVGGLPEVVRPLAEELVLESADPAAIAYGLRDALLGRRPLPSSDLCRNYVAEHYGWPRIVRMIREVYLEAIS
jgi:glycosyltransferase involved in cell wall biosynthesis